VIGVLIGYVTIVLHQFCFCLFCVGVNLGVCTKGKHRLFENRVLMIIFGPMKDEITGEQRKLHNEK
jgi:hypothetical protein